MTAAPELVDTEALWRALHAELGAFIRRRVSDPSLADDLLQETFVRIHRGLDGLDDHARVGAWAYRIARNVIIDHLRARRHEQPLGEGFEPPVEREDERNEAGLVAGRWLLSMIPHLPETYREAVRLAEVEGLRQTEIAARLGLSHSGAKSRVQRGRRLLREMFKRCCDVELDRRGNLIALRGRTCNCTD